MINIELADLAGFRLDGRKDNELRSTSIELGVERGASGSCYMKQGMTEVLCIVNGPIEKRGADRPGEKPELLEITYTVAPFSAIERREHSRYDKEFSQFAENIRKSFQALIFVEHYPRSTIQLIVTLIQSDGSSKSTILNCITLALINSGVAMRDFLISATVGCVRGAPMLDITSEQGFELQNELVVSFVSGKQLVDFIQLRDAKIGSDTFRKLNELAVHGCNQLYTRMKQALIENALKQVLIR